MRALREMAYAAFGDRCPHVDVYDGDTAKVIIVLQPVHASNIQTCLIRLAIAICSATVTILRHGTRKPNLYPKPMGVPLI